MATQLVFQQPVNAYLVYGHCLPSGASFAPLAIRAGTDRGSAMSKKKRPNKAKSIIAQPLFRSRQERPGKGKGSYNRQASQQNWEACSFVAA